MLDARLGAASRRFVEVIGVVRAHTQRRNLELGDASSSMRLLMTPNHLAWAKVTPIKDKSTIRALLKRSKHNLTVSIPRRITTPSRKLITIVDDSPLDVSVTIERTVKGHQRWRGDESSSLSSDGSYLHALTFTDADGKEVDTLYRFDDTRNALCNIFSEPETAALGLDAAPASGLSASGDGSSRDGTLLLSDSKSVSTSVTGVRRDAGDSVIGDSGVVDLLELSAGGVPVGAALGSGSSSVSALVRDARASVKPVVVRRMRCATTLLTNTSRAERTCRCMRLSRRRMFGFSLCHRK